MNFKTSSKRIDAGFTLIELLVVISIISLLSSIIIGSVNVARAKSKDTFIKQQVNQMRTLMAQEFSDTGDYTNLQVGSGHPAGAWFYTPADCDSHFTGNYATQAKAICKSIVSNSTANFTGNQILWVGNSNGTQDRFSIMAYLPGKASFYCAGSSGQNSDNSSTSGHDTWPNVGCYGNP